MTCIITVTSYAVCFVPQSATVCNLSNVKTEHHITQSSFYYNTVTDQQCQTWNRTLVNNQWYANDLQL